MDIVKKNFLSILCGVVALAGIVIWFFPIGGMYDALAAEVKTRGQEYGKVDTLRKQPRNKPTLQLGGDTEREPLGRFPNNDVIEAGKRATVEMKAQSDRIIEEVRKVNVRTPLTPNTLPTVSGNAALIFARAYLDRLGRGEEAWAVGLPADVNATTPPSPDELNQAALEIYESKYVDQIVPAANNKDDVDRRFLEEVETLPDVERVRRARAGQVYLSPDALPASPDVTLERGPTPEQIWYAQNVLWVLEDVVKSIVEANADARNVTDAPVKHWVSTAIPFGPDQYVLTGKAKASAGSDGGGGSAAVTTDANGAPAVWSASPTGRVCNDLYDVVHFDLVLRVDASRVPQVIASLERSKLVTVLRTSLTNVDAAAARRQEGYVYGDDPVVQLALQCEVLFLRKWTLDKDDEGKTGTNALMPIEVQRAIGAAAAEKAAASDDL